MLKLKYLIFYEWVYLKHIWPNISNDAVFIVCHLKLNNHWCFMFGFRALLMLLFTFTFTYILYFSVVFLVALLSERSNIVLSPNVDPFMRTIKKNQWDFWGKTGKTAVFRYLFYYFLITVNNVDSSVTLQSSQICSRWNPDLMWSKWKNVFQLVIKRSC